MPSLSQDCLENLLESFFTFSLPNPCRENMFCHVQCVVYSVSAYWLPAQKDVPVSMYGTSSMSNRVTFLGVFPVNLTFVLPSPRMEALWGRDCFLARAESIGGTYWKGSICVGFFFLLKVWRKLNMKTCKIPVSLCPLEIFLRRIKPLNQGSLRMYHLSLSSGWFPSVRGGCTVLVCTVMGCQWVTTSCARSENFRWFWRNLSSRCAFTWLRSCKILSWYDWDSC